MQALFVYRWAWLFLIFNFGKRLDLGDVICF